MTRKPSPWAIHPDAEVPAAIAEWLVWIGLAWVAGVVVWWLLGGIGGGA